MVKSLLRLAGVMIHEQGDWRRIEKSLEIAENVKERKWKRFKTKFKN